ncbi:MarR family winged helix-turn-helix transcriptional regulator [Rhizobium sp. L1K21]|uniref:MarR family winged helix-turn-helix transcriptional regulator n=1 Tax=Rhizobium sp. L1K21 TaxID=2954933 RepID=UPI0020925D25|nr:MarR family transcriptional regulator [Rhizobium sp. L1K21]MCO6186646.1 MarR family transcriptional regulator [Rhizobium sp. L1K21]
MDDVDKIIEQWHRERPDLDVEPMALIGRLAQLREFIARRHEAIFSRFGLNSASFDVLATLRRSGSPYQLSPGELMESMMITSGTVTNRIDQLVKAGLVTRQQNPQDRRSMIVTLTPAGLALIEEVVAAHVENQRALVAPLSEQEREALNALLKTFLAKLSN